MCEYLLIQQFSLKVIRVFFQTLIKEIFMDDILRNKCVGQSFMSKNTFIIYFQFSKNLLCNSKHNTIINYYIFS